jgi:hypothetical protein
MLLQYLHLLRVARGLARGLAKAYLAGFSPFEMEKLNWTDREK